MADYDSSLPIRSEADGTDERVHSKIVDYADPSGAGKQLEVTSNGEAKVQVQGDNPSGGVEVLRMSELGHAAIDGFYDATNNSDPSQVGLIAHTRAASPADTDQIKKLTAITNSSVHALDISLHDEDGAAYSAANPLPVFVQEGSGSEINNYDTAAAVAAGATDDHIYTVPGGNDFLFKRALCSASGKMKVEIQVDPDGLSGYSTIAVGFNSTAQPNIVGLEFAPVQLSAGGLIKIIRTNKDNQSQDLYSTIIGVILA